MRERKASSSVSGERNGRVSKAEHALYPESQAAVGGERGGRKGRSLKVRASRNSDVAFGLETTAHEWKLFTWRPRLAGVCATTWGLQLPRNI